MSRTLLLFVLLASVKLLQAQSGDAVLLHTGASTFPENVKTLATAAATGSDEIVDGNYYRLLQFFELPNKAGFEALAQHGIELLEYIPHKTYVASIPSSFDAANFVQLGVRSIQTITPELKLAAGLRAGTLPDWASDKNQALLMLKFFSNLRHENVLRYCLANGIRVLASNGYNNFLKVSIPADKISDIALLPWVAFLEPIPAPSVHDDIFGRSLHRSNVIDAAFPSGRHYTGEGVSVLVRDDGVVGPHIDFQGRLDNGFIEPQQGSHGDGVAGIIGAAGNLDPWKRGMAAGAYLYAVNYEAEFLDETMDLFFNNNVLVTNSSYSNGCNDGYTEITETVDQQLAANPTLIHVFSAGNSNGSDCDYGAGGQWGNITGGHKQAKNAIATANLWADATINSSSSRGPAHDGRLKPDIAAHGADQVSTDEDNFYQVFGGTSAASPGIAGILAQLHQAHRDLNGGATAEAPLLKAILLNTANDLGNAGPDYIFGWGHVNAYRAALTLEEHRYFKASVEPGETATHTVHIPAGVTQARIMVYWLDPAGTVLTTKALVNDLDISLKDAADTPFLPWLLNPTPSVAALSTPAGNGIDTLNNMEQIALNNPAAGDYVLTVHGKELPFGAHSYYVVWEFRTEEITVTHPAGGEGFAPGDTVRIHWDAQGNTLPFSVEYSTDAGNSWNAVASPGANQRMTDWIVPNSISAEAKIRVSRDAVSDETDEVFSIAPRPQNVKVEKACPGFIRLSWDAVSLNPASDEVYYEVFRLGNKYMEVIDVVTSTTVDVPTIDDNPALEYWYAVRATGNGGLKSERTIAIQHNSGLLDCTQNVDMKLVAINSPTTGNIFACGSTGVEVTITVQNTGLTTQTDVSVFYELEGQAPVLELIPGSIAPGETKTYTFSEPLTLTAAGNFLLTSQVLPANEQAFFDNTKTVEFTASIYTGSGEPLEYQEDFEDATFPPPFFLINNLDESVTWDSITVIGSDNASTVAVWMNFFDYSEVGALDDLLMVPVDLTTATGPQLSFDLAYAQYPGYTDGLRVEVSTDCGASFQAVVYEKFGDELETVPDLANRFFPEQASDWRNETISLGDFIGQTVVLKFVSINGYGNALFLDNINIKNVAAPVAGFSPSGTEICQGETIAFVNTSTGEDVSYAWDFGQGADPASSTSSGTVVVNYQEPGTFTPTLTVSNAAGVSVASSEITVNPDPVPAFSWVNNFDGTVTFTNLTQFANNFLWNFGDGGASPSANPNVLHEYAASGTYTVKLTASNPCGSIEFSQEVDVLISSLDDVQRIMQATVLPNPNSGNFDLVLQSPYSEPLTVQLSDVRGAVLEKKEIQLAAGKTAINFEVDGIATGMYFLKIQGEKGAMILKVIKK